MLSSMLASPLPLFFLGTYCLSTSSLGCNTLCMVISFLLLSSTCLSSSLVYLKEDPEHLTWGTAQAFIPLTRFLLNSFVSSNFLVILRYSYLIFFLSFLLVWCCQPPRCPTIFRFPFIRAFKSCLDLIVSFRQSDVVCYFSLLALHIFYTRFHSYVLTVYSNGVCVSFPFFFIFCKWFDVIHIH